MKRRSRAGSSSAGLGATLDRAGPAQATSFAFAHATPDAELLTVVEGVLQAVLASDAAPADLFGLAGGGAALREEEIGVDSHAVRSCLPTTIFHAAHQFDDFHC